jgi:hypothetical protein
MAVARKRMFFVLRLIGKILLYGFLVGVAINLPFVGIDIYHSISKAHVFDKIQIGMPAREVELILYHGGILCGINASTSRACYFSDFWRHYEVALDPDLQEVRSKSYFFKERWWMIDRLRGRNTHHTPR